MNTQSLLLVGDEQKIILGDSAPGRTGYWAGGKNMAGFRIDKKTGHRERTGVAVFSSAVSTAPAGGEVTQGEVRPRQESGRSTVRLTLTVPRVLHTQLKLAAVRQEKTMAALLSGWIAEQTAAA